MCRGWPLDSKPMNEVNLSEVCDVGSGKGKGCQKMFNCSSISVANTNSEVRK